MSRVLQCSNRDCSARTEPDSYVPMFKITLLVMANRDGTEDLRDLEPECFSCYCCGSEAEETKDE